MALEQRAQIEIEGLGESLDLSIVIVVAMKAYPALNTDDAWFIDYLKTQSKVLLTSTSAFEKAIC